MEKVSIKEAQERLNVSRATLYRSIKALQIQTQKIKRVSYLSQSDFETLKNETQQAKEDTKKTSEKSKSKSVSGGDFETQVRYIEKIYKNQVADLQEELKKEREDKNKISYLLGQAQQEHQQTKQELLKLQHLNQEPEKQKKSWWKFWSS